MWKNNHVVMLPTNQAQNEDNNTIYLNNFSKELILGWRNARSTNQTVQHLYITSDEEIKEGDWVILNYRIGKSIDKALPACLKNAFHNADFWNAENKTQNLGNKPIIATTDTSLRRMGDGIVDIALGLEISYIPESFIKYFIEEYNKGNVITKVMVEYVQVPNSVFIQVLEAPYIQLKINSDNTINIKPIKNSWNREEHIANIKAFAKEFVANTDTAYKQAVIDKWIENNL